MSVHPSTYVFAVRNEMIKELTELRMKHLTPQDIKEMLINGEKSENYAKKTYEELVELYMQQFGFLEYLHLHHQVHGNKRFNRCYDKKEGHQEKRRYTKRIFQCILDVYSKDDPSICDFGEGKYYEAFCFDNHIELNAHDGEIYIYNDQTWLSFFTPVQPTKTNLSDIAQQAKAEGKNPYNQMNPYEFAGIWINRYGNEAIEKFHEKK